MRTDIGHDADGTFELHVNNFGYEPELIYHTLFHVREDGKYTVRSQGSTPNSSCEAVVEYFRDIVEKAAS